MVTNKTDITVLLTFLVLALSLFLISGCSTTVPSTPSNLNNSDDSLFPIDYTPMQCNVTPWNAWLSNSSIRFIRAPTEQEVITMFYGQYNVTLTDLKIVNTSDVTCEACGVCSKGYKISAYIQGKNIQLMRDTGWNVWLYQ